ncbi:BTB/POZ domain-containing protein 6-B-like isoform X5 [Paramacrobiotus metropolitanus]|nr:BTB/POZ domain-containing protein 6-B-like isoform X5 [Paramacrobiotus metropolitanus]
MSANSSQWRSTLPAISDQLKHILASGAMSDVQFTVGSQYGDVENFSAHKFVLSLGSDVFDTMFNGGLPESGDSPIDIPEILPEAFATMLKYLYTRSVEEDLKPENVFETIYCADKYNLPHLMELCLQFANTQLNADNCLVFLEKVKYSAHECKAGFVKKCLAVVDAQCSDVLQSDQFSAIKEDTLEMILQRSTLSAEENVVYMAVEKWSVKACVRDHLEPSPANRREVLGSALFLVRFPLLTDAQLANGPIKSGLLLDSELRDIYQFKHVDTGSQPHCRFPTEPRQGSVLRVASAYATFTYKEEVFADVDAQTAYWWPAKVIGIREAQVLVTRNDGKTVEHYPPHNIVRAADILKKDQKLTSNIFGMPDCELKYIGRRTEDSHIIIQVTHYSLEWSCPFDNLRISRAQMAARKPPAPQ